MLHDVLATGLNEMELTLEPINEEEYGGGEGPYSARPGFKPNYQSRYAPMCSDIYDGIYDTSQVQPAVMSSPEQEHFRQVNWRVLMAHSVLAKIWAGVDGEKKFTVLGESEDD